MEEEYMQTPEMEDEMNNGGREDDSKSFDQ